MFVTELASLFAISVAALAGLTMTNRRGSVPWRNRSNEPLMRPAQAAFRPGEAGARSPVVSPEHLKNLSIQAAFSICQYIASRCILIAEIRTIESQWRICRQRKGLPPEEVRLSDVIPKR